MWLNMQYHIYYDIRPYGVLYFGYEGICCVLGLHYSDSDLYRFYYFP